MKSDLAILMRDIRYALQELRHMPGVPASVRDARGICHGNQREAESYSRWIRKKYGPVPTSDPMELTWSTQDETAD